MSPLSETSDGSPESELTVGLRRLAALPGWLIAAMKPETVIAALERHVPEFAAGEPKIRRCKADLRLKGARWAALYELTINSSDAPSERELTIVGSLTAPDMTRAEQITSGLFGTTDWRCYLPELGLDLRIFPDEAELEALPLMTDPELARAFLEQSIRAGSSTYADMRIKRATPKVMRNKPGRCTVRYRLEYDVEPGAAGWPELVIGKTYSGAKGQNAYNGMRALWDSPLSRGDVVVIAEPLAYIPEHKILVQGPVPGQQDFKDLLKSALRSDTPEALEELQRYARTIAAGLVALHHSDVHHGETITWEDEIAEIREEIENLSTGFPWLAGAITPLLSLLASSAAIHLPDPTLPSHHSFRPQQVLLDQGRIGFIDFDDYCMAEPALDIAQFRATVKEMGINTSPSDKQKEFEYPSEAARLERLRQLNAVCDIFLTEYERLAPIFRPRVVLWEALDLLTIMLRCWTKVKPHQLDNAILLLDQHLRANRLIPETQVPIMGC